MSVTIAPERIRDLVFELLAEVPGSGLRDRARAGERLIFTDHAYSPVSPAEFRRAITHPCQAPPSDIGDELSDCDDCALQVKVLLTARRRRLKRPLSPRAPPAIGLVVAECHAVNVLVATTPAGLKLFLADASRPDCPIVSLAGDVPGLLQDRPAIRLVYF